MPPASWEDRISRSGHLLRLLIDACVAKAVVSAVRECGFDTEWVAEWDGDPGDRAILRFAHLSGRILVTRYKDFGELIYRDNFPHSGPLRLAGEMSYSEQAAKVLHVLDRYEAELSRCAIVTITSDRIRISRLPTDNSYV